MHLELDLAAAGVTFLFGPSGSGKTTLLRIIAGLEHLPGCDVNFQGQHWQSARHFTPVYKRAIGYVFQESSLFPHLTVAQNLNYGLTRLQPEARHVTFDDAVAQLGLETLLARRPDQLSGGQRQRVAIARALLRSPQLLLMDEPLASLDVQSKAEILPYFEKLQRHLDIPVLYVSHAVEEVLRLADHMLLLKEGELIAEGPVNELMTDPKLPLAHLDEASAVVKGEVLLHEPDYHLTYLKIAGGKIAIARNHLALGTAVKVRVLARDVSIALQAPSYSSITNVLTARIDRIEPLADPSQVLLKLDLGGEYLLARITQRSLVELKLQINHLVFAQIKSVALMR